MIQDIGNRFREIRKKMSMTLSDVSQKTGLSVGYLSNLERNLSSPTLDNMQRICAALNTSLITLLNGESHKELVVRSDEREVVFRKENEIVYELIKFGGAAMDALVIRVEANCTYQKEWTHTYDEIGLIIEGQLTISIEKQIFTLKKGDSFYIRAGTEHSLSNYNDEPCVSYWVRLGESG